MPGSAVDSSARDAETDWLDRWAAGPTLPERWGLPAGTPAPDLLLADETGAPRRLAEFWADGPALVMFWRHFGCSCGVQRAERLRAEWSAYRESGLTPVIVAQGDPARAAAYRERWKVLAPILTAPAGHAHQTYAAYGVGHWPVERVLYDAPREMWSHTRGVGARFQQGRREASRAPVDDPWLAAAEFVVGCGGTVRLSHVYQYCEDFPDPRVLTTAAELTRTRWQADTAARQ